MDQLYTFWKVYQYFLSFDYAEEKLDIIEPDSITDLAEENSADRPSFEDSVEAALDEIEAKHYQKIVLAQKRV